MSRIRSKNVKPEIALRKALYARGYRYRTNYQKLPIAMFQSKYLINLEYSY